MLDLEGYRSGKLNQVLHNFLILILLERESFVRDAEALFEAIESQGGGVCRLGKFRNSHRLSCGIASCHLYVALLNIDIAGSHRWTLFVQMTTYYSLGYLNPWIKLSGSPDTETASTLFLSGSILLSDATIHPFRGWRGASTNSGNASIAHIFASPFLRTVQTGTSVQKPSICQLNLSRSE